MNLKRLLFLLLASCAASQAHAFPGLLLNWDDCSVAGSAYKLSACDQNGGSQTLILSFRAPDGIGQLSGVEAEVILYSQSPAPVPIWWHIRNQAGQCRQGALSSNADFVTGPSSCLDPFAGQALGGVVTYDVGAGGDPRRVRLVVAYALPSGSETPLTSDEEYYAAKVVIDNRKTTGADACAGCQSVMGVWFSTLNLHQPPGVGDYLITDASTVERNFVGWQGECQVVCTSGGGGCSIQCTTPAARPTWGAVKSLYR